MAPTTRSQSGKTSAIKRNNNNSPKTTAPKKASPKKASPKKARPTTKAVTKPKTAARTSTKKTPAKSATAARTTAPEPSCTQHYPAPYSNANTEALLSDFHQGSLLPRPDHTTARKSASGLGASQYVKNRWVSMRKELEAQAAQAGKSVKSTKSARSK